MAKIFISYQESKGHGREVANLAADYLRTLGHVPWMSGIHMKPGAENFVHEIRREIETSDFVLGIVVDETDISNAAVERAADIIDHNKAPHDVDWVALELEYARRRVPNVPRTLLNASHRSANRLLPKAWGGLQIIEGGVETNGTFTLSAIGQFSLWKFLAPGFRKEIDRLRNSTLLWARETISGRKNIFETVLQEAVGMPSNSLALIAPAGSGKTQLLARLVENFVQRDETVIPFLIEPDVIDPMMAFAQFFAKTNSELAHEEYLRFLRDNLGYKVLFIADAYENSAMVLRGNDPDENRAALLLSQLTNKVQICVSCRDHFWTRLMIKPVAPDLPSIHLKSMTDEELGRFDPSNRLLDAVKAGASYLRSPLLADLYFHKLGTVHVGDSSARFLTSTFASLEHRHESRQHHVPLRMSEVLSEMASWQLNNRNLDVPKKVFDSYEKTLDELGNEALLDLRRSGIVRLKHDTLDAFNMARLLVRNREWNNPRPNLVDDCLVWPFFHRVLASVAAILYSREEHDELDILLSILTWYLDRKALTSPDKFSSQNWHSTYALQDGCPYFKGAILRVLDGGFLDSKTLDEDMNNYISRVGSGCTQESASTLWSALGFEVGSLTQTEISQLTSILDGFEKRWRLYEVIAANPLDTGMLSPNIHQFLLAEATRISGDGRSCEGFVASIAESLALANKIDLMVELFESVPPTSEMARILQKAIAELHFDDRREYPVAKLLSDLQLVSKFGGGKETYSDWKAAERALRQVSHRRTELPEPVFEAVARTLNHLHERLQSSAAQLLTDLVVHKQWPMASAELVNSFLKVGGQSMAFYALSGFLDDIKSDKIGKFCLAQGFALSTFHKLTHQQEKLQRIVRPDLSWSGSYHLFDEYVETAKINVVANKETLSSYHLLEAPIRTMRSGDPGPDQEIKYGVRSCSPGSLDLSPVSWGCVRSFHKWCERLFKSTDEEETRQLLRLTALYNPEENPLPGIAVCHVVVTTADNKVIWVITSDAVMTVSYQEQINEVDVKTKDPLRSCAIRGMFEELNCELPSDSKSYYLGPCLELDILNVAVLIHVKLSWTSSETLENISLSEEVIDFGVGEINEVAALMADRLGAGGKVHGSAPLRLSLLAERL